MKNIGRLFLAFGMFCALAAPLPARDAQAAFKRQEDVIYGHKSGVALTMDVFQPEQANGAGIVFIVSGDWVSSKRGIRLAVYEAFLKRGYTVFAVTHGSQPKFQIPEMILDIARAVRFIRFKAGPFGIDPHRLGVCGMSSGGHLSLMLATQGAPGDPNAKDPVDQQSSAVQCVACFYPPTDFVNYGAIHTNVLATMVPPQVKGAFGRIPSDPDQARKFAEAISPIHFLTSNLPPTLIIQGDADRTVPMQQAISFRDKAVALGDTVRVEIKKGQGHGWRLFQPDMETCADWFDQYLRTSAGQR